MSFEMNEKIQTLTVYNLRADTSEFIGAGDAYIPAWTGLPANSTDISPGEIPSGYAAVFNSAENEWAFIEDHRGETVYNSVTGEANFISVLGPLPENTVTVAPSGNYQKWNGNEWVTDEVAQRAAIIAEAANQKNKLMQNAASAIAPLQDAVDLNIATDSEAAGLAALKKYRVLLNRVDTATAPDITWTDLPA